MASALPKTCKAAVFEATNTPLVIKDVPVEAPKQGEILIKVLACGVCHSDEMVQQGMFGSPMPIIPGHEVVGTVVALGPGETKWKEGDRVGGGWHGGHDGNCNACERALYQMCDNEAVNGVTRNGGYAEYCILRREAVVRVPSDLDPAQCAPLLCAGVTTFNGIRQMNILAGEVVAVQGLGGLGHLAIQYARRMGYRTVALSTSSSKKELADQLGATDYIGGSQEETAEALQKMGGAALIVVTAPNPKIIEPLLKGCAPKGKILVLAAVGEFLTDSGLMIMKGLSVHGWPSGHQRDSEEAIAFARQQGVKCMVEQFPLDRAQEAMEHMLSGKVRFRCVLTMNG